MLADGFSKPYDPAAHKAFAQIIQGEGGNEVWLFRQRVGVTSYDSEAVGKEASRIIGKGRRNEEQNVGFTIKGQVEDKDKDGKNG